jgi:hypothetical protein
MSLDGAADRGRRRKIADLAWRLRLWAKNEPEWSVMRAFQTAADEVDSVGRECWADYVPRVKP